MLKGSFVDSQYVPASLLFIITMETCNLYIKFDHHVGTTSSESVTKGRGGEGRGRGGEGRGGREGGREGGERGRGGRDDYYTYSNRYVQ